MENLAKRSVARRYFLALLAPALMAGVMQITWPLFERSPIALFLLAIMFSGWYGGFGAGALSLLVSIPLADYFFIYPYYSLGPQDRHDVITLLVLTTIGLFISLLSELTHRGKRRAEVNLESAQEARLVLAEDIKERREAEEALRDAEDKYRDIFENAVEGIFQTSPAGGFIHANPALARMLGFDSPAELIRERGSGKEQRYHNPGRHDEIFRLLQRDGVVRDFEYEEYRKDGSRIWVSDNVRAVRDRDGELRYYEGTTQDITERKRAEEAQREAEEALRQSEVQLAEAQHLAHVGSWNWDIEANVLTWSDELCRVYGFQPQELSPTYENFLERLHPEDRDEVARSVDECLRNHEGFSNEERIIRPDGEVRVLHSQGNVVCDALGNPTRMIGVCQDITERKQVEDALRESEERYRALFENAKDATYVHDLNGRYISVNRAAEKLSGHTRHGIIGRTFSDFVPLEEVGMVTEHLCEKLQVEGETTYETEMVTSDGSHIPVEVSSHLIYENGTAIGVQGTARDITERRRAEERLREYEKVVEGLEEMIIVVDRDFRYLLANRAYLKYRGVDREEVVGRLVPDVVSKNLFEGVIKKKLEQAFQGHVVSYEVKPANPELGERYLLASYFPIEGPTGIDRVACVLQDITERKQAEEALRQSEERFSKAFHSSPAALSIALFEDGRLLEVNAGFLRMTGYSLEEVIGRSTLEIGLWANAESRSMMTEKLREGRAIENLEFSFRKKSGEVRNGLLSVELIELGAEQCILGIIMDTTERIRAEEALQSYPRRLIEAQETERQSIARELHDQIGQVMTAIRINLQTVWDTCETPASRALIDEGVAMVDEALAQVRDLSFELRPSLLDDLGLVAALRWYSDRFARRTGIHTATAIDLPESTRLRLDLETACFRIVQEALTNVVRHAKARRVSITLKSLKNEICLSIKDNGLGFDPQAQNHSQLITHLGLRAMKERALALGGRLEIKSSPSRGTEIRAHFPEQDKKD